MDSPLGLAVGNSLEVGAGQSQPIFDKEKPKLYNECFLDNGKTILDHGKPKLDNGKNLNLTIESQHCA